MEKHFHFSKSHEQLMARDAKYVLGWRYQPRILREQAGAFVHHSSWYSNLSIIEFAELLGTTLPGNLSIVNFTVTGSEANEVAMRMALGVTGKYDIVSIIRGLHGGSLAAESVTTVGGARKRNLGPLMMPSRANAILPPFCYRCPINLEHPGCDIACLDSSEQIMESVTSQDVAAVMAEAGINSFSRQWRASE